MAFWNVFKNRKISACRKQVRQNPEDPQAYFELATALESAGKFQEAIEPFEKVLSFHPKAAEVHYNLGVLYEKISDGPSAIQHMIEAGNIFSQRNEFDNKTKARKKLNALYQTFKSSHPDFQKDSNAPEVPGES